MPCSSLAPGVSEKNEKPYIQEVEKRTQGFETENFPTLTAPSCFQDQQTNKYPY